MKRTAWCLLAVGLALLSGVLAQSLQPSATAEETDDGSASIRVLLQLHESAGHDARYRAHVDELVSSLKGQTVADDSDNADAAAAADVEEEAFGEAPAPAAAEVVEAVAADGAESQEPWNAGAAFVEVDTNSDDAADADAEVDADAEEEVFGEAPERPSDAVVAEAEGDVEDDGAHWSAGAAFVEVDAGSDDEADAEAEAEEEVFGEAPDQASDAVVAEAEGDVEDDGAHWSAGPAFVEVDADSDSDDAADADAEEEVFGEAPDQASDAVTAEAEGDVEDDGAHWNSGSAFVEVDADEEDAEDEESDEEAETAFVQVGGDWKDPPVWWKAPEEEMANADQQPWPLDPNFPMSVLDPPPNLPLANIEDANNYPPMADPNMAFNIDPTAFPQTNAKVGEDDPSFASFSINGR